MKLLHILLILTASLMDDSEIHALSTNGLSPVPEECLHGMRSPGFIQELCIPPFLNGMIVHAATDRIKEESILIGLEVSNSTTYLVQLYKVDFYDEETVFMNELLVRPENYTIQTMIVEPKQDYVNDTSPSFIVSVHKSSPAIYRGPGIRLSEPGNNIRGLDLGVADIPCSEKFNFTMEMGKKNLTRYYYRHLPRNKTAKAILIQYHGWSSSCEKWEEYSKTAAIADKYGFMLISACGSYYGFYSSWFRSTSGWNAGVCCIRDNDVDDVEYTKQILKNENKNNLPVYGYGYSNGGMMVESLLCHNVLDKAVSVNAVLALKPGLQGAFKTCDTIYRNETSIAPKVASVHCADDGVVPYNGSVPGSRYSRLKSYFTSTLFPRTNRDMRRWAKRLGCETKASIKKKINDWTRLKEWKCPGEARVVSIKRLNCSHTSYINPHSVVRTFDFDPAEWAAKFFVGDTSTYEPLLGDGH